MTNKHQNSQGSRRSRGANPPRHSCSRNLRRLGAALVASLRKADSVKCVSLVERNATHSRCANGCSAAIPNEGQFPLLAERSRKQHTFGTIPLVRSVEYWSSGSPLCITDPASAPMVDRANRMAEDPTAPFCIVAWDAADPGNWAEERRRMSFIAGGVVKGAGGEGSRGVCKNGSERGWLRPGAG